MKTKNLAKHYGALTARERFALLVEAHRRGDKAEALELLESAPRIDVSLIHSAGVSDGAMLAAMHHCLCLHDYGWNLFALVASTARKTSTDAVIKCLAHIVLTYRRGWELFCAELGVEPDALLEDLPGQCAMRHTLNLAEAFAPSPDEIAGLPTADEYDAPPDAMPAEVIKARVLDGEYELLTPEGVADMLREFLELTELPAAA